MESVGNEGKIQIKDFDVKPVPNQLAELLQVGNKDGAGGRKGSNSTERRAREGAWLRRA